MSSLAIQSDSDLLTALLDPSFSLDDVALGAGLDLAGLLARMQSEPFRDAFSALDQALSLRLRLTAAALAHQSLAALQTTLRSTPDPRESRRAAVAILRLATPRSTPRAAGFQPAQTSVEVQPST